MNSQPPNELLKDLRARLGITTRDVAELSQKIAETQGNPEFQISNAWLTQIENSNSVPSIFKLYSLSAIYRLKFTDLLCLYGLDLQKLSLHQITSPLPQTHLTTLEVYDATAPFPFSSVSTGPSTWTTPIFFPAWSSCGGKYRLP